MRRTFTNELGREIVLDIGSPRKERLSIALTGPGSSTTWLITDEEARQLFAGLTEWFSQ